MLAYLDTLIGFAIVMLVVSLLITILTQTVSGIINHRGSNLLWGLKTLFANMDPKKYPALKGAAEPVAREVLSHCLISDSWFNGNRFGAWLGKAPVAGRLVARVKLASAIRVGELEDILRHLASNALAGEPVAAEINRLFGAVDADVAQAAQAVQAAAAGAANAAEQARAALPRAAAAAGAAAGVAGAGVAQGAAAELVQAALPRAAVAVEGAAGAAGAAVDKGAAAAQQAIAAIQSDVSKLEAWFGSIMDRVSQKFAMYMRIWTVGFAVLFAFGTGLNAIQLLSDLYANGAFRNALVGAGAQVTDTATLVLDPRNSVAAAYTDALKQALADAGATGLAAPENIATTAAGAQWILARVPEAQRAAVQQAFDARSLAASQKIVQDGIQNAAKVTKIASQSGFEVMQFRWPAGFPRMPLESQAKYILGVLMTAALLSLGAPFWFNALKSMANLRPIVASKEDAEQDQSSTS